jgi:hypothetical protein
MKQNNIMVSQVHQRNDIHSCFEEFRCDLPNLDYIENHIICIPVGWWLSESDRNHIVSSCNSF